MAHDERLAERIRDALPDRPDVEERRMFGNVAWMVGGNMACATMGDGLLVRLGPDGVEVALAEPYTGPAVMGQRTMKGYLLVDPAGIADDATLQGWVDRSVAFAESLPPK